MRVLVTGANGFLGRQILAELKSQGYTPLAFVRGAQSAKQLQDNGFDVWWARSTHLRTCTTP